MELRLGSPAAPSQGGGASSARRRFRTAATAAQAAQRMVGLSPRLAPFWDAPNGSADTPLHQAAERGYVHVVEALLRSNADVNATRQGGLTALHLARTEAVADALLAAGIDADARAAVRTQPRPARCRTLAPS